MSAPIQPGTLIGRYEVIKLLSRGGLTSLYLARDPELNRLVALKINDISEEYSGSIPFGLLNEARILGDLQHPSLMTVFDIGRHLNQPYIVCEHLPGSLQEEMEQSPASLTQERIVSILIAITDALDLVHRRGYIHRDLKPRAILLDNNGRPRLSGFEIAGQKEELSDSNIAGTVHYMSPEHFEGKGMGPYSDVWSLGVTMYQLLTGQLPFEAQGMAEHFKAVSNGALPSVPVQAEVPTRLAEICLKCLARKPDDRYANAGLLAADLRAFQRGVEPPKQQRVFVSHATKDRDFVEREIIGTLEKNGVATWYSKVDIQSAAEWHRSILQGLESTDWFLIVMSAQSLVSEWVRDELYWAIDRRVGHLIPVLIDDSDPREFHIRMARVEYVDFRNDLEQARNRLLATFKRRAN